MFHLKAKAGRGVAAIALITAGCAAPQALAQPAGRDIYVNNCSGCHQANGAGSPGDIPALIHDPLINGAPTLGARIVLEGAGPMPNFDQQLTDDQIASVLTYVRSSFGNHAAPVTAGVVAGVRKTLSQGR